MKKIKGLYVAMMTIFKEDGSINEEETKKLLRELDSENIDGIFVNSSIGEGVALNNTDFDILLKLTTEVIKDRSKVVVGITSMDIKGTKDKIQILKKYGYKQVVIAPPYYYANTSESLLSYYLEISKEDIEIILYNIPLFTTQITKECFHELLKIPNIIALKDSSGSALEFNNFLYEIKQSSRKDFSLLVGREEFFLGGLLLGADGCMLGFGNIKVSMLKKIYEAYKENKFNEALKFQLEIIPIINKLFSLRFPLGFKAALEAKGYENQGFLRPLTKSELEKYMELKLELKKIFNN